MRFLFGKLAVAVITTVAAVACCNGQRVGGREEPFYAAYLAPGDPGSLFLFPLHGPEMRVALPADLSSNLLLIGSSPDGTAIYLSHSGYRDPYPGITKIEFNPARKSIVPGSVGLGSIYSLSESPQSGKIFVSASTMRDGRFECGDYEIDTNAGVFRPLRVTAFPECVTWVSPGGKYDLRIKRELRAPSGQLVLRDLATGAEDFVGKGYTAAAWSPDGRLIAAALESKSVVLIDVNDLSKKRKVGSGEGPIIWSPDSEWLLLPKPQFSCALTLYFESLQMISVETRKAIIPPASHCRLLGLNVVWVARDAVK